MNARIRGYLDQKYETLGRYVGRHALTRSDDDERMRQWASDCIVECKRTLALVGIIGYTDLAYTEIPERTHAYKSGVDAGLLEAHYERERQRNAG